MSDNQDIRCWNYFSEISRWYFPMGTVWSVFWFYKLNDGDFLPYATACLASFFLGDVDDSLIEIFCPFVCVEHLFIQPGPEITDALGRHTQQDGYFWRMKSSLDENA